MKKRYKNFVMLAVGMTMAVIPVLVMAQVNVNPQSSNTGIVYECPPKQDQAGNWVYGECQFSDLVLAVKKIINWATVFTLEISVVIIAYAGYLYMTSGDNPTQRKDANKMLLKVVQGIALIIGAWLLVTLITNSLLTDAAKGYVPLGN